MSHIKVGVLRGGPSKQYEVSLKNGQYILNLLKKEPLSDRYTGIDIFIDRGGLWHIDGMQITPEQAVRRVDVVFNTLKGEFGEDGKLQRILEDFSIPYTGSSGYASALSLNKSLSKDHFKKNGIKTPYHKDLNLPETDSLEGIAHGLFKTFPMPVVVKPKGQGSSLGVSFASNFKELLEALEHARGFSNEVLVEEYISGKEIVSGFIEDFRGQDLYHLFPVEIKPHHDLQDGSSGDISGDPSSGASSDQYQKPKISDIPSDIKSTEVKVDDLSPEEQGIASVLDIVKDADPDLKKNVEKKLEHIIKDSYKKKTKDGIFDWTHKYSGSYDHHSPSSLSESEKQQIKEVVSKIQSNFHLNHYATADFIIHPKRGVYLLEVNALPHIHEHSPIYSSLSASGVKNHEFVDHLIRLALKRLK
jgi:D-alanine-D-alanine ligase-like ATP-grasp enzyme